MAESEIEILIQHFARLPGLGPRSARRAVLHLLTKGHNLLKPLAHELIDVSEKIKTCEICRNLDTRSPCGICSDEKRDKSLVCVIEEVADLWALERNSIFRGRYHVLGGTLSAIDGKGPEHLGIAQLIKRIKDHNIQEVIVATNATVEGQTTAHYIAECIASAAKDIKVSRLGQGVPIGGELDYLDEGTLSAALTARQAI